MFKVIWLLNARPGVSHAVFRDWYETSHAVISEQYFGHLLLEYRRNYPLDVGRARIEGRDEIHGDAPQFDYDCITEWVMEDEAAFDEIMRIFTDPVIGKIFFDDSADILDPATVLIRCDPQGRSAAPARNQPGD